MSKDKLIAYGKSISAAVQPGIDAYKALVKLSFGDPNLRQPLEADLDGGTNPGNHFGNFYGNKMTEYREMEDVMTKASSPQSGHVSQAAYRESAEYLLLTLAAEETGEVIEGEYSIPLTQQKLRQFRSLVERQREKFDPAKWKTVESHLNAMAKALDDLKELAKEAPRHLEELQGRGLG